MEYLKIPEFPILCGEKAIKALHDFIDELEKERVKELTDKQTTLLIRLAKGLISSIEAEKQADTSDTNRHKIFTKHHRNIPSILGQTLKA